MKALALILVAAAGLSAQSNGEIRGYAWDAEGRPMADVKVTLHAEGGKDDKVTTRADGSYDARDLAPGHYQLSADQAKRELKTESDSPLELKAGQVAHVDLTLGKNTKHYGFWTSLGRRLDGLPH
jgi:hypothetical protein